ncbi:MAG: hypothetical protein ACYCXW_00930 [Solirubrobacteraceae bacterium]
MIRSSVGSLPSPRRTRAALVAAAILVLSACGALATAGGSFASAMRTTVCEGSVAQPGQLDGTVHGTVIVNGVCDVSHGSAKVDGSVTVSAHGVLNGSFGGDDLTVMGSVVLGRGASALLGCEASRFPCTNDPSQSHPTLSNRVTIAGSLTAFKPLGVIVHVARIGGSVSERGGGGATSCSAMPGFFRSIKQPAYSDFEDDSIAGALTLKGIDSCWIGVLRNRIGRSVTVSDTTMADPDAIELGSNRIGGNLACAGNRNLVASSAIVWDTSEVSHSAVFPRRLERNHVRGRRSGQCVRSTPTRAGGPYGAANTF